MTCNAMQSKDKLSTWTNILCTFEGLARARSPLGKPCKATRDFLEAKSAALHDKEETRTQIHGLQEDWQDGTSARSLLRLMHNRTDIMSKSS